jgi:hypothetical protein
MDDERGSSARVLEDLVRIKAACGQILTLRSEIEMLERRVGSRDLTAIHMSVRKIAEGLVRAACKRENIEVKDLNLRTLTQQLQERLGKVPSPAFYRNLKHIGERANEQVHFQEPDHKDNSWGEVELNLVALAEVAKAFIRHWPPPKVELPTAPHIQSLRSAEEPAPKEPAPGRPNSAATPRPAALEKAPPPARPPLAEQRRYGSMNVAQAREDQAVRGWLATHSDLQQRGVTRRLNAEHGRCKLHNVFPSAFPDYEEAGGHAGDNEVHAGKSSNADPKLVGEAAAPRDGRLDYLVIGRLTVAQARELNVAEDIVTITGLSPTTVKNKLRTLHGSSVIHRQFPWFTDEVVGEMTVSTALRYELASFLPAAFGDTRSNLLRKLRRAPGQTKLKNLFAQLGGSKG